jgi:hypothetical protein
MGMSSVKNVVVLVGLAAFMSHAAACSGTQALPISLRETARIANVEFAGTVDNLSYRLVDGVGVVIDVRFRDLKFARGPRPDSSLVLTIRGGRTGGHGSGVIGLPSFDTGARCIILATTGDVAGAMVEIVEAAVVVVAAIAGAS